jgi:hypothetical protein
MRATSRIVAPQWREIWVARRVVADARRRSSRATANRFKTSASVTLAAFVTMFLLLAGTGAAFAASKCSAAKAKAAGKKFASKLACHAKAITNCPGDEVCMNLSCAGGGSCASPCP